MNTLGRCLKGENPLLYEDLIYKSGRYGAELIRFQRIRLSDVKVSKTIRQRLLNTDKAMTFSRQNLKFLRIIP